MFDPSSFANPTPLAHADTSRDVLPRGGTSHIESRCKPLHSSNYKASSKILVIITSNYSKAWRNIKTGNQANTENCSERSWRGKKCHYKTEIDFKKLGMLDVDLGKSSTCYRCILLTARLRKCEEDSKTDSFGNRAKGLKPNNPKYASCGWSVCMKVNGMYSLTARHRATQRKWAAEHRHWMQSDWSRALFAY
ncbi:hypothetical protein TNCV_2965451 [Trichonephila clavipes]|nr:hypothetical protein TNCV_2965451 [Trichonephila clavipes]